MSVNPAGGARVFIGTTNIASSLMAFEADSYIEIEEVEDGGQIGDEFAAITFTALKDGRVRKFKGPRDAGTLALVVGNDPEDEGQAALEAAQGTKFDYNFKIELNDQLTLNGTPSILYFYAKVMSQRDNIGTVSNVVKTTFNLGVNSPVTKVLPT